MLDGKYLSKENLQDKYDNFDSVKNNFSEDNVGRYATGATVFATVSAVSGIAAIGSLLNGDLDIALFGGTTSLFSGSHALEEYGQALEAAEEVENYDLDR